MFSEITMIDYRKPLATRTRKVCGPYRWRPTKPGQGRGFYMHTRWDAVDEAGSTFRLRIESVNGSTRRGTRSGYAFNQFGDSYHPIIARLPKGRGFLAGATMGRGMCAFLDPTIYRDEDEARSAAHTTAEHAAHEQAEYEESECEEIDGCE